MHATNIANAIQLPYCCIEAHASTRSAASPVTTTVNILSLGRLTDTGMQAAHSCQYANISSHDQVRASNKVEPEVDLRDGRFGWFATTDQSRGFGYM